MVWDPFEEMKRMQAEMERAFRNFMEAPMMKELRKREKELSEIRKPLADVIETESSVIATIEMPGVDKDDIVMKLTETSLDIKAEKKKEAEIKKKGFYSRERTYKGFHRFLTLPAAVEPNKAKTEFKNGILRIEIPKKKAKKKTEITLKVK